MTGIILKNWCRKCKRNILWSRRFRTWYHEWSDAERICGRADPDM